MKINVEDMLQKEVTRTEFLGLVGAGILSVVGVTALLKNLSDIFDKSNSKVSTLGYGGDAYGGTGDKSNMGLWK